MYDEKLPFRERLKIELSDPLRYRLALRTATACLVVQVLVVLLKLPDGSWALLSAFLIVQLSRGSTLRKGSMRIAGTAAGCLAGFLVFCAFNAHPLVIIGLLSAWVLCLAYVAQRGFYPYAMLLASLTPFMVSFGGASSCGQASHIALERFFDITLGVLIAWAVVVLLWPIDEASHLLSNTGKTVKRLLCLLLGVVTGQSRGLLKLEWKTRKSLERQDFFLKDADFQEIRGYRKEQIDALQMPLKSLFVHTLHAESMLRTESRYEEGRLEDPLSPFLEELRAFIEAVEHLPDAKVLDHLSGCSDTVSSLSKHLEREHYSMLQGAPFCNVNPWPPPPGLALLMYTTATLRELVEISTGKRSIKAACTTHAPANLVQTIFPERRIDGASLKNAIKLMTSVLLASVLWVIRTGNVQAAISAGIVANQAKQSASYMKLVFRLLGTLVGGAMGLAYVASVPAGPAWLIGLSPAILFLCSYVGLGDEDWSYVGLTAGLCFILCLGAAEGGLQAFGVAVLRIKGVVAGGMTAAVVMKFLFPFDYHKRMGELRRELLLLYERSIAVTEEVVTGGNVTGEEIQALRMEMRKVSIEYVSLISDASWDRLQFMRKRRTMEVEANSVRSLYRHFFSILSVCKPLASGTIVEPEIMENLRQIFADTSSFLRTRALPQAAFQPSPPAEMEEAKTSIFATLDRLSSPRQNLTPGTEEVLFFLNLLLQYLNRIIQELEVLWGKPSPETDTASQP
jgi:uncharacterized membrane protein YgaE (UPF0421/DUF939 family)